jgi:cyclopropane-fatty-acyl-phospholipid synthase
MVFNPSLLAGEGYMNGTLTVENGSIYDLLEIFARNLGQAPPHPAAKAALWGRRLVRLAHQINPVAAARANAAYHYDLSGTLYDLFLDADRQYSCAYFADAGDDLESAQKNKKHHIAAKLLTAKGFEVLPRRWVVERTFAWLGRCRRLAKDFEATIESAVAWITIASIRLITRRLARA